MKKTLAIGAHPDDIELGCGATLHKLIRHGTEVSELVFSKCVDEVPKGWNKQTLANECKEASKRIGSFPRVTVEYPNKNLESARQEILDILYGVKENLDPDLVFCPSSYNSNQDHITVYNETRRAFRDSSILGYTTSSSDYGFAAAPVYSIINEEDVKAKVAALLCYKSQFALERPYSGANYAWSILKVHGVEVWRQYAEKFENIRYLT